MSVPAEGPTIGSLLHEGRQRSGLSLKEIAQRTCIRRAYLEALEADRFELLPGDVYVQGFTRLYAEAIGLDAAPLLEQLRQLREAGDEEGDGAIYKREGRSMTLLWVLLALIMVGAAGGLLYTKWHAAPPAEMASVPAAAPVQRQEAATTDSMQAPSAEGEVAITEGEGAAKVPTAMGRQ